MFWLFKIQENSGGIIPNVKEKLLNEKDRVGEFMDMIIQKVQDFIPVLLEAILVLLIGLWVIKRIAIITEKAMTKKDMEISLKTFLKSLVSIGLKIILIVSVAGILGIGTTSFVTILGAAGLAIGFALQGSLANFAGGVLILIFKPFKVGDQIEAQGITGTVTEIQIFNTLVTTFDQKIVILPNGVLSNNIITNVSRSGILRADITLTLQPENDPAKVVEIVTGVLKHYEKILKSPEPVVLIGKIADGSMTVLVRPFCETNNKNMVISELHTLLKKELDKNGISQFIPKF
ncbi:MAG: mechanosensitive ion channel [Sphingobacteriaceae bacterium]|nr:mechanosensitive ion channel [Sphingobacteriaceae bacterium]